MEDGVVLTRPPVANYARGGASERGSRSRCALVAGADAQIRQLLRTVLEIGEFDVVEAASQGEVLSRLTSAQRTPDVVILDVALPHFSGLATLSFMRREPKLCDIPVVVLTSFSDPPEHARFRQSGATAVMTKPFSSQRLLETIKQVVVSGN
jgi:CheY-like chemotaxis protein